MNQRKKFPSIELLTYFDVFAEESTYHYPIDRFNDPCPARKNGFITHNGDFFPCDFLRYVGQKYFCGNVVERGFLNLWENSEILRNFQNTKHTKCKKCRHYMKRCYGGCISGSIASTENLDDNLCFIDI